ncbi:MAG: 2-amino-4-hydroxy-6-hydroxymethyldihydropteridine diphosphokinase [Myxococcota bacterium]|nr:2-amino-4-hydroxy-6-hydroxymethyldihydropteridine diphosphokinase [Myxococcota bacterium]
MTSSPSERLHKPVHAYIAAGGNLGPVLELLDWVRIQLENRTRSLVKCSRAYRTRAHVLPGVSGPVPDYWNCVFELETSLRPLVLLKSLLKLETEQGRVRLHRWEPRALDLDLVLYGQWTVCHRDLVVPHPRMYERRFVLEPLHELNPRLTIPGAPGTLNSRLEQLRLTAPDDILNVRDFQYRRKGMILNTG